MDWPTRAQLYNRFLAGERVEDIARELGLSDDAIDDALRDEIVMRNQMRLERERLRKKRGRRAG